MKIANWKLKISVLRTGLGSSRFTRRYLGNTLPCGRFVFSSSAYWNVLLQRVGSCITTDYWGLLNRVSPFGNPRIKGCYAPPRGVSSLRYVLHRLLMSRHPPFALSHPAPSKTAGFWRYRNPEISIFSKSFGLWWGWTHQPSQYWLIFSCLLNRNCLPCVGSCVLRRRKF